MRILVLGGTAEGRAIANAAVDAEFEVVSSLAGRTKQPIMPEGSVRVGGFGGVGGLAQFLRDEGIAAVINATHPFAARMAGNALEASLLTGVPLLRFVRPSWANRDDATSWVWVDDHSQSAAAAASARGTVFLTIGRQHSLEYAQELQGRQVLCRVALAGDVPWPPSWDVLEARGPFSFDDERALMQHHRVGVLVTKDAGGAHTAAKLDAARELGVQVVMLRRPEAGGRVAESLDEALDWLRSIRRRGA